MTNASIVRYYTMKKLEKRMSVIYMHLSYEHYKNLETQMKAFEETSHTSTGGFYHKSVRLQIDDDTIIEFHGPLVGGYGHKP